MIKKAILLHGTDGNPEDLWFPWLKDILAERGFEVFAPILPDNDKPNVETYDSFLRSSGWDFSDNIIIGHSSGATTVLNLLQSSWLPKIKAAVLVGTFLNEKLVVNAEWYAPGKLSEILMDNYSPDSLMDKCDKFYFVHGDDDPYCDFEDAKKMCKEVGGKMITIKGGGHLAYSSGIKEIPTLISSLEKDNLM